MKKLLLGATVLPLFSGLAMAGEPMALSNAQMDQVTAGVQLITFTSTGSIRYTSETISPSGGTEPVMDGKEIQSICQIYYKMGPPA